MAQYKTVVYDLRKQLAVVSDPSFKADSGITKGCVANGPCHCGSEVPYKHCHHPHAKEKLERAVKHVENSNNKSRIRRFFSFIFKPFKVIGKAFVWLKNKVVKGYRVTVRSFKSAYSWTRDRVKNGYTRSKIVVIKAYRTSKAKVVSIFSRKPKQQPEEATA